MKPIDRILVPTDFSTHSKAALDQAVALALRLSATIDLLFVWPRHPHVASEVFDRVAPAGPPFPSAAVNEFAQTLEGRELDALLALIRGMGVKARGRLESGDPARAIVKVATEDAYGLIVMGTHGRTGLPHLVLGSVAESVVRHAPCPVMTVRLPERPIYAQAS